MDLKRVFQRQFLLLRKVKRIHVQILPTTKPHLMILQIPEFMLGDWANIEGAMVHDLVDSLFVEVDVAVGAGDGVDCVAGEDFRLV